jgi:hypothetical protein
LVTSDVAYAFADIDVLGYIRVDTIFNGAAAKKSGYAILGGKNHSIIVEAIVRVYDTLWERYEDFITSEEFLNCKEEQAAYKQDPIESTLVWATDILINLLKEDSYLRKELGEAEENKLYDDFYILNDTSKDLRYNPLSTLSNCLKHVIEKYKNADKYKDTPLLPKGTTPETNFALKREIIGTRLGMPINKKIKLEINEREFLNRKLASGQTFEELLQEVHREYIRKTWDDLVFEHKLLALGQTIQKKMYPAIIYPNQLEMAKSRITQDDIWEHFLKRDKTGRYTTYDKQKILKKLWERQNDLITFVEMKENQPVLVRHKLYEFDEILLPNKSEYYFSINTSSIALHYKNYLYIDLNELEKIKKCLDEYWGKISQEEDFKKNRWIIRQIISNQLFRAAPYKLNMLLKYRYHRGNDFENEKTGYKGNCCHIPNDKLNIGLGDIDSEIVRILETNHYTCNRKDTEVFNLSQKYILGSTFYCATKLKWLVSNPNLNKRTQEWSFNLNRFYFDNSKVNKLWKGT